MHQENVPKRPGLRKRSSRFARILPEQYVMAGVAQDRHKYNAEYLKGRSLCKAGAVIHSTHIGFIATIAPCQVECIPAQNKLTSPAFPQVRLGPDKK